MTPLTTSHAAPEAGEKFPSINIGGSLPTLTLKNEKNKDIQIADLASEKGVVLFLVPKADTRKEIFNLAPPNPERHANMPIP